jgi:hypothetical protein
VTYDIDIVLRDTDRAVTQRAMHPLEPSAWSDANVREILKTMLAAIDRAKNPAAAPREVTLRGFSWIVQPFDSAQGKPSKGLVVIAIEIPTGAAVAGPFAIEGTRLTSLIERTLAQPPSQSVH